MAKLQALEDGGGLSVEQETELAQAKAKLEKLEKVLGAGESTAPFGPCPSRPLPSALGAASPLLSPLPPLALSPPLVRLLFLGLSLLTYSPLLSPFPALGGEASGGVGGEAGGEARRLQAQQLRGCKAMVDKLETKIFLREALTTDEEVLLVEADGQIIDLEKVLSRDTWKATAASLGAGAVSSAARPSGAILC